MEKIIFVISIPIIFVLSGTSFAIGEGAVGARQSLESRLDVSQQVLSRIQVQKTRKEKAQLRHGEKLGRSIQELMLTWEAHRSDGAARGIENGALKQSFRHRNPFLRMQTDAMVQVYVTVTELDENLLASLSQQGLEIELSNEQLRKIQGWISVDLLGALSELPEVVTITAPRYGRTNSGSAVSEGDAIHYSDALRDIGFTGQGIRVGIISDGAHDWTGAQASGDLPVDGIETYGTCTKNLDPDKSQCEQRRTCNEGTAMAEIIHDLAPEAQLAVASGGTSLEFIQQISTLINDFGADIIVDDILFYGEPYFEDGDVAEAVEDATTSVLYVTAAGNAAGGHYLSRYEQSSTYSWHDFGLAEGESSLVFQDILVPPSDFIWVIMQWNDPFLASSNDYNLYFWDYSLSDFVAASLDFQNGAGSSPIEGFCYYNATETSQQLGLLVDNVEGNADRRTLEIFTLGAYDTWYNHPEGSIIGHPAVSSVVTVGAVQAGDEGHDTVTPYSSRGPARVDFPTQETRNKPDLIGIDGVSVTGTGEFSNPFYGTSASAPHIAAMAAQLMSVSPTVTADHVRDALTAGATDIGASGYDFDSGYGLANALQSYELLEGVTPGDINGDGAVTLADAIVVLKLASDLMTGTVVKRADMNDDDRIGIPEAIAILKEMSL